jgi:outer membrane protein assembly factor BamB
MKKWIPLFLSFPVMQSFAQSPEILWSYDMNDMAFGQAASADVDRDGLLEVCFSTYRNDGLLRMLNAEDGSELWVADAGGCADAAPLIYDVDMDGDLEVILAGSCDPTTYCFDADSGFVQWETPMRGSDSPPVAGDIDNDGKPEIIHGQFGGYVLCLNGEDGSVVWELEVDPDSWIQTEPALLDVNFDGQLDFVVATWSFYDNHKIFCYQGDNAELIWENDAPEDVIYHGVSFGDMDNDDTVELVIGDYAGILHCFNAFNGELNWQYQFPSNSLYIGGPTSMGDLNDDGYLEVVFSDWFQVGCLDHTGELLWDYSIPDYGQAFRGMALADINGDEYPDVTFCSDAGFVIALAGESGEFIQSIDLQTDFGDVFGVEHGPLIADFNDDGILDVFAAGGYAEYPAIENNYGRVYMVSWGEGNGPDWKMFRRDYHRSACLCNDSLLVEEDPVGILDAVPSTNLFSVYPNPFSSYLAIQIPQTNGLVAINLYSADGSLIYTENKVSQGDFYYTLPAHIIHQLTDGIYLIQVQSQGRTERFTMVHTQP